MKPETRITYTFDLFFFSSFHGSAVKRKSAALLPFTRSGAAGVLYHCRAVVRDRASHGGAV